MWSSLAQLITGMVAWSQSLVAQPPVYFTQTQIEKPLIVKPSPSPSPSPSQKPKIEAVASDSAVLSASEAATLGAYEMETEQGIIHYKQKLTGFWAVSYDSSCEGCDSITATGMKQGYGVVAVDPKVIPLFTKVYVPGYGIGVAGDVGGGVKGKIIDLGYDKLEGQWGARWVDVYVLVE